MEVGNILKTSEREALRRGETIVTQFRHGTSGELYDVEIRIMWSQTFYRCTGSTWETSPKLARLSAATNADLELERSTPSGR